MHAREPSGGALRGDSDLFRLFRTDETDVPLPQGCATLESLLLRFAAAVAGMEPHERETLRGLEERHYRLESLRADREDLKRRISQEAHLERKYALAKQLQDVGQSITELLS